MYYLIHNKSYTCFFVVSELTDFLWNHDFRHCRVLDQIVEVPTKYINIFEVNAFEQQCKDAEQLEFVEGVQEHDFLNQQHDFINKEDQEEHNEFIATSIIGG